VLCSLLLVFTSIFAEAQSSSTADWQAVDFNGVASFRLPPGFARHQSNEPEDERVEYHKGETKLVAVWGRTESPAYNDRQQAGMNDYHESTFRLSGQRANVRTYWQTVKAKRFYRAELNVGNWERGEVQLYMALEGDDSSVFPLADQIFKSVRLSLPPPERPSSPVRKPAAHIIPSRATPAGIS
jgi:hypothetical protein